MHSELEPDLCWSFPLPLPLRPSKGHSVLLVGETDECAQLITPSPFLKHKLHLGLSPIWGLLVLESSGKE